MPRKPVVAKEEAQKIADEVFSMQVIPDAQIQQEKTIQQIRTETVEHLAAMNNLAVATLGEVMRSKTASDSCRLKAAQIALSYGVGRPHEAEYIDENSQPQRPIMIRPRLHHQEGTRHYARRGKPRKNTRGNRQGL